MDHLTRIVQRLPATIRRAATCALATAWLTTAGMSAELPMPEGDVVLTVTGDIGTQNAPGAALFDLELLRSLPSETYVTKTLWTEGEQEFKGVLLSVLLNVLEFDGNMLHATAINDYAVDIPVVDIEVSRPLIAYENNGEEMSVRDKGPLWIVFPYDDGPEFQTEVIFARSIWQLDRIELVTE